MGSESTPRSKLADTTRHTLGSDTEHPITDREGQPATDRHGADLPPGSIVGDYQIERKLGHGGMGSVYEAIHPVIEKRVAIKVLLPELSRNEEAVERFKSEARAVNRIRHPSIVDVFGYGTTEDGRCFLVMELLDGESLGRRMQYDAPSIAEACEILIQITHALDAAHASGIVHRDLKPDNVILIDNKHVKLLDFGIAKLSAQTAQKAGTEFTQPGQAMGTPRYIAPEQARGDAVDGRTDIYSLGVMAFELLVGRLPFVGDNAMELIAKHITLPPPTPTDLAPMLPPAADTLLLKMLDKEPANRPELTTVRAMLDEIRAPWVTSVGTDLRIAAVPPPTVPVAVAAGTETIPRTKKSWWIPLAIGAGLAVGAGTFALVRGFGRSQDKPDLPSPPASATTRPAEPEPAAKAPEPAAKAPEPTAKAPEPAAKAPEPVPAPLPESKPASIAKPKPAAKPIIKPPVKPLEPTVKTPETKVPVPAPPPPTPPPKPAVDDSKDGLMLPEWRKPKKTP